jgi:hypothetical protein
MNPPDLILLSDSPGKDSVEQWHEYIEQAYAIYCRTVAYGKMVFRGLPVRCQFRPETYGKHYAFWHMMQEGRVEDQRTPDLRRCERVQWIGWVIANAFKTPDIHCFYQQKRKTEQPIALWLHTHEYVVILLERNGYYLLKTAFVANKTHKQQELERDWRARPITV